MEIRQLRYLIKVAETRSFSEASRLCFLSQSAISQQIKLLEGELDTQLFLRSTHVVSLTEAGEELLPLARQALKSFETCQEHINGIRGLIAGNLNIGLTAATEPYARYAVIEMLKRYPKLHINMHTKPSHELHKMLVNHELDIAFTMNTANENEGIESTPINSYSVCAIMSKTHPLANRDVLSIKDIIGQSLILPENNSGSIRTLKQYIAPEDLENMNIRAHVDNVSAILNILQDTNMVSLLAPYAVAARPRLVAKTIKEFPATIQNYAHRMKAVCPKQSSKVFMDILVNESIPFYQTFLNKK